MLLDDDDSDMAGVKDKAGDISANVDTRCAEQDTTRHNTFATLDLTSGPVQPIDTSGPWFDLEEGCYVDEPAPGLGLGEQRGVPPATAQTQPQTLHQSSKLLQDQTNQQGVGSITESTSVESALHSLPKRPDSGDDGWTDNSMAELEKELGLAVEEQQMESSSAGPPNSPSTRSVEAPQEEIQTGNLTTGSRPEELQATSRHGT
jgi:hypothetical protein